MKQKLSFELEKKQGSLRWKNYADFLASALTFKQSGKDTLVSFLTYNASSSVIALIEHLMKDCPDVDVLIIDNCSDIQHYEKIRDFTTGFSNVYLARTTANIGGAGGYALITEIFINSPYAFLLLTEDDAVAAEPDVVNELYRLRKTAPMIGTHYYNNNSESFSFHFTLYNRALIEAAGTPDPRFFQGGDDAEIRGRHLKALQDQGHELLLIDRGYYHPTLKGSGTPAKVFRSQRNSILSDLGFKKWGSAYKRVIGLLGYSIHLIFQGRLGAGLEGLFTFSTIPGMKYPGCVFLKNKKLNSSADSELSFHNIEVATLKAGCASPDLARLLRLPVVRMGESTILTSTLETPWMMKYLWSASDVEIVKNLSNDNLKIDFSTYKLPWYKRLAAGLSMIGAVLLSVPVFIAYICLYYLSFSILEK